MNNEAQFAVGSRHYMDNIIPNNEATHYIHIGRGYLVMG